jgi:plasmid stability protein
MTLTIDLPDEEVAALAAKARAQGVSAEQYARLVLEHDLKTGSPRRAISQTIREIWSDMPAEVQAKLPSDGASQVDHYVYGLPKRDQ